MAERIKNYAEFYRFYLSGHQKTATRVFHFLGTLIIFFAIGYVIYSGKERFLWYIPIAGYGLPWLADVIFEKNPQGALRYPLWSLISDFRLFFELLTGKQKFRNSKTV